MKALLHRIADLYIDGFRKMTLGRKLWAIMILKLAIMFLVLKLFFFPNILQENYDSDEERARAVAGQLTDRN